MLYNISVQFNYDVIEMPIQTTYSKARANFAKLCNEVTDCNEIVLITRRKADDVALISASELSSLLETAHLLRSPKNAERLLRALNRAIKGKGKTQKIGDFREQFGIEPKNK